MRLYVWQRATAALMLPLVLLHVAASLRDAAGMTAADILTRTRGSIVWAALYGAFVIAAAIHAAIGVRNVLIEWSALGERAASLFAIAFGAALLPWPARGCRGGAVMTARRLAHRTSLLWLAALVHRLSGLALAIFLPLHFLALGLAIRGEATRKLPALERPAAGEARRKRAVPAVHRGAALLLIENLAWRDGQKELAAAAAGISAVVVALILLVRMF